MPDNGRVPGGLILGIALAGAVGIFLFTRSGRPKLMSIILTPSSLSLLVNEQVQLQAAQLFDPSGARPADLPLTWASAFPAVATVDSLGRVKGTGLGTTQITASAGGITSFPALVLVPGILGDVNGDGVVNVFDQIMLQDALVGIIVLTPEQFNRADMNRDGVVDIYDAILLSQLVSGGAGAKLEGVLVTPEMAAVRAGQSQQFNAWGLI
jgi:hypothetical protein